MTTTRSTKDRSAKRRQHVFGRQKDLPRIQVFHKQLVKYETSRRMARAVSGINASDSKGFKMNLSGIFQARRVPCIPGETLSGDSREWCICSETTASCSVAIGSANAASCPAAVGSTTAAFCPAIVDFAFAASCPASVDSSTAAYRKQADYRLLETAACPGAQSRLGHTMSQPRKPQNSSISYVCPGVMSVVSLCLAPISVLSNGMQPWNFHTRDSPLKGLCAGWICVTDGCAMAKITKPPKGWLAHECDASKHF
jgi:hypothetical protein